MATPMFPWPMSGWFPVMAVPHGSSGHGVLGVQRAAAAAERHQHAMPRRLGRLRAVAGPLGHDLVPGGSWWITDAEMVVTPWPRPLAPSDI